MSALAVGDVAPDFTLTDQHGQSLTLSEHAAGRATLLVFFPFAFSGICSGELTGLRDRLGEFETDRTTVVTLSCDPVYALRALADRDGLFFPMLSDFWPHGEVTASYGVLDERTGGPTRSSFVLDGERQVRWTVTSPSGVGRDLAAHATELAALV